MLSLHSPCDATLYYLKSLKAGSQKSLRAYSTPPAPLATRTGHTELRIDFGWEDVGGRDDGMQECRMRFSSLRCLVSRGSTP